MNAYQQKWLEIMQNANLPGWKVKALDNDIYIDMPSVTDLKIIRDNLPETLAAMSLDIDIPVSRLKFIFHNGFEKFEYILNPDSTDLSEA
ncbi:MAG: hypothetical protein JWR67_875 [Mucilaginibacter sp.]|jgi:hypothetical protein|nr:hypothetical protein [Mucilaginibacter sp.]